MPDKKNQEPYWISVLPEGFRNFLNEAGEISRFVTRFFREVLLPPYEFKEILRQSYEIGNRSLPLVGLTSFIIGLVLTLQSRQQTQAEQK